MSGGISTVSAQSRYARVHHLLGILGRLQLAFAVQLELAELALQLSQLLPCLAQLPVSFVCQSLTADRKIDLDILVAVSTEVRARLCDLTDYSLW